MADKIKLLVVGVGSIGERHLRCFANTGRVEVSFCETNEQKRHEVAQRYGVARHFSSLEDGLGQLPDAVVIATPAHMHIPMATKVVMQGCHVLIEKPLSTTIDGVEKFMSVVAGKKVVVSVAYVYRMHPALSQMREALRSGRFGKPLQVVAVSGQNFPFYRPAYRETYYTRHDSGGGAIQDALTHVVNAVEWIIGPVDRLVADASHMALTGVSVEDTVNVITRHGDILGSFTLNQHQAPNENTITVVCEKGTVRFEYHEHRWRWLIEPGNAWHDESAGPLERDTLFVRQADHFLDEIKGIKKQVSPLSDAIQTLRVNLAILKSVECRSWETINRGQAE